VKVLHVIPRYPPAIGGAEQWCQGVARWQARHGDDVEVLTLRAVQEDEVWGDGAGAPTSLAVGPDDDDGGVRVHRCALAAPAGPALTSLLGRSGLLALARAHSPELYGRLYAAARRADVVHAHCLPGPHVYAAWLAARAARRPLALTPHFHAGDAWFEHRLVRSLLRRMDVVFADSRAEAESLAARGVAPERVVVTMTAIDPPPSLDGDGARRSVREALGVAAGAPLLVFLGRKSGSKSIDVLFDAMDRLRHRPHPVLAVAGPTTGWYRSLLAERPRAQVREVPVLSPAAKAALLAAADVLVLPSAREAFGIVFLEAWAAGLPVIGADIPAVREVVGEGGLLFSPGDADALAACIDEIVGDPARARALAANGRARLSREHTWEHLGALVSASYARVAPRR
jgi:glycosyltransferase involved in cell wall biosynthesis